MVIENKRAVSPAEFQKTRASFLWCCPQPLVHVFSIVPLVYILLSLGMCVFSSFVVSQKRVLWLQPLSRWLPWTGCFTVELKYLCSLLCLVQFIICVLVLYGFYFKFCHSQRNDPTRMKIPLYFPYATTLWTYIQSNSINLADLAAINFAADLPTILVLFASLKGFLLSTETISIICFR